MSKSKIEWTDEVWNPIAGCTKVSAGCKNCYAEKMAKRCVAMGQAKYVGTVDATGHWTGQINFDEAALVAPLRWKRPRMVFVNSMSDLFHESVPDVFVDRVFAVMALCPQHTFQVLTKRPERMAAYMSELAVGPRVLERIEWTGAAMVEDGDLFHVDLWPLPNVWLGTSVENQAEADKRIPWLLQCPAAVRFLSCEPLLGPVDIAVPWAGEETLPTVQVDWVICGGESKAGARPMHPDWARGLRDQCQAAGVPFFFKQWGEWVPLHGSGISMATLVHPIGDVTRYDVKFRDGQVCRGERRQGDDPEALWYRVGKKAAGRLLDGREWNEMPEVAQ